MTHQFQPYSHHKERRMRVVLLGSTGSIGTQTLDVVRQHADEFEIVGLAAYSSTDVLLRQATEFSVKHVVLANEALKDTAASSELACTSELRFGQDALIDLITITQPDIVVNAMVGAIGMYASLASLQLGVRLALANKESLVVAGDLIMPLAFALDMRSTYPLPMRDDTQTYDACITHAEHTSSRKTNSTLADVPPKQSIHVSSSLMPIDSEHGALFQCLLGESYADVKKLWVTASGGPFRGMSRSQLTQVSLYDALSHPTWNMGAKITIDSSTLMNKGLEIIEAHHLFGLPMKNIEVVVQPQSAIHSMVEFCDGSVKAHLGQTDMRIPIQFALSYPRRFDIPCEPVNFTQLGRLDFLPPDTDTFRCLALARYAGEIGKTLPCVMNAANEVAVASFLRNSCTFLDIEACVDAIMQQHISHDICDVESLEQLAYFDTWARMSAQKFLSSR